CQCTPHLLRSIRPICDIGRFFSFLNLLDRSAAATREAPQPGQVAPRDRRAAIGTGKRPRTRGSRSASGHATSCRQSPPAAERGSSAAAPKRAGHILQGRAGAICWSIGFGPSSHKPLKCVGKYRVCSVVLARVENHPHLVETVLLSLQELDNR